MRPEIRRAISLSSARSSKGISTDPPRRPMRTCTSRPSSAASVSSASRVASSASALCSFGGALRGRACRAAARQVLGLAHRQPAIARFACDTPARVVVRCLQHRATVSFRQTARLDHREHLVGKLEQAHQVRHRDTALADPPADLFLRQAELVDQCGTRPRRLDRVQVLSRHVLDQRQFEALVLGGRADDRRNAIEAGELRSAPATLAREQLVAAARQGAHEDRLQHTVFAQRPASSPRSCSSNDLRGWLRVGRDQLERDAVQRLVVRRARRQDRGEPTADTALNHGRRPPSPARSRRPCRRSADRGGSQGDHSWAPR